MVNKVLGLKILVVALILTGAFGLGRYSVQVDTVKETKAEVTKGSTETHEIITIIKRPDGTTETKKVIDKNKTEVKKVNEIKQAAIAPVKLKKTVVSALAGIDMSQPDRPMVYGAAVSTEVIGPVSIGLFGLTNKTVGVSLGISF